MHPGWSYYSVNDNPVQTVFIFSWLDSRGGLRGVLIAQVSRSHADISQWVWLLWTRDRPTAETSFSHNARHSLETDNHAPSGIRTRNPRKRVAVDPRLRTNSHWNRLYRLLTHAKFENVIRDLPERQTLNSSSDCLEAPQFVNTMISRKIRLKTWVAYIYHLTHSIRQCF